MTDYKNLKKDDNFTVIGRHLQSYQDRISDCEFEDINIYNVFYFNRKEGTVLLERVITTKDEKEESENTIVYNFNNHLTLEQTVYLLAMNESSEKKHLIGFNELIADKATMVHSELTTFHK